MLIVFEKGRRLRHVGHLDLMRTMQRALRRSDLPIRFSQGFNPHLLITFAAPLSVGMIGKREIMEVPISTEMAAEEFGKKLSSALPEDLNIISVRAVEDSHPASMSSMQAARFEAVFDEDPAEMFSHLEDFLKQDQILVMRKSKAGMKETDLRPLIYELRNVENKLYMTLALSEKATCKPDLLLEALSKFSGLEERPHCIITRTQLLGERDNHFIPLEDA